MEPAATECLEGGVWIGRAGRSPKLMPFYGYFGDCVHGPTPQDGVCGTKAPSVGLLRDHEVLEMVFAPPLRLALTYSDDGEAKPWEKRAHREECKVAKASGTLTRTCLSRRLR